VVKKIAFILTEFPKTTETFIMRDIMFLHESGLDVRIFHLQPFNRHDVIHDFARPTLNMATHFPYVLSVGTLRAFFYYAMTRPRIVAGVIKDIVAGAYSDPVMLMKSIFIVPASMRIAAALRDWKADHVHATYAGHPATTAWIARRLEKVPYSVSSHAHDLFETQALLASKLPEASFVRTISEYNKAFILKHVPSLASRPPEVIHVGVTLAPPPERRPPAQDGFSVLYVGSLEKRKGVDTLLGAFKRASLPGWRLEIIGDGPERVGLEALANRLGLKDSVSFSGARGNSAVLESMAAADVLAVPSRIGARRQTEGLPTVIVEALSCELPVVATRLTGIPEIVRHEETGLLFEMDDEDGLASALLRMAEDPEAARRWAEAGRRLVEQEFDQRENAKRLLDRILQTTDGVDDD
jgi:glycosyltransferase involved in cell wall biosynthesis